MPNRLIDEQSPYLLQHAHNPVDWYPWGSEAFEKAKKENKPVLVSIGYAACHWCHVMERESFENETVAKYMNDHFVNIKVDREEYPDVDHMYMDAVQAITGNGGWPLNVFVTPNRVPFYGGTYFPPRSMYGRLSWPEVLERMNTIWHKQQEEVTAQTEQMVQFLKNASSISAVAPDSELDRSSVDKLIKELLRIGDKEKGGFSKAPKFLGTMAISTLIAQYHYRGDEHAIKHAIFSLDSMLDGGIYDQVGGGISRYATDDDWLVPHFEKMLYDNALLVSVLSDAYMVAKKDRYKQAINDVISFVNNELKHESEQAFYSALDADSEGVEGKFYTWSWEDWLRVVGGDEVVEAYYGVVSDGNWEGVNILHVSRSVADVAQQFGLSEDDVMNRVEVANEKLNVERAKRVRPQLDDKSLLSWNALMNIALSKASIAVNEKRYIRQAEKHMGWMLSAYAKGDGRLYHTWKDGKAKINSKLDDYAYLIKALIELTNASGNGQWLIKANGFMELLQEYFAHENNGFFYFSSSFDNEVPIRKVDIYDGAQPSANAILADSLIKLGLCMEKSGWVEQGRFMIKKIAPTAEKYPYSFGQWAIGEQCLLAGYKTAVFTGSDNELFERSRAMYAPSVVKLKVNKISVAGLPVADHKRHIEKEEVYICDEEACLPPVDNFEVAKELLTKLK